MQLSEHVAKILRHAPKASRVSPPRTGYVIYSGPYVSNSAGIGCLHRLCDELNRRGFPSFTTGGRNAAEHLDAPMLDNEAATDLCARGFAAIYPETIIGNPLNARTAIRWVLNRPGLLGGEDQYADSELVFLYSDVFAPYIKNSVAGNLYMPTIDTTLFYCEHEDLSNRSLECYYVGKSEWKDGTVDRTQAFEITRENPAKKDLGKLFRSSKVLYCFDNSTILIYEALLCGCPVVVIPDGTQTKQDFEQLELGIDGISWGLDEYKASPVDVAALRAKYEHVERKFVPQLEQMIAISQTCVSDTVDWDVLRSKESKLDWWLKSSLTIAKSWKRVPDFTREIERSIRRVRKRLVKRVRENVAPWRLDDDAFYCTDWNLNKRTLECFCSDGRPRQSTFSVPREAFEVTRTTSACQMSKLFRASRQFYSFDEHHPLINYALACGCPVTLAGKRGHFTYLTPSNKTDGTFPHALRPNNRQNWRAASISARRRKNGSSPSAAALPSGSQRKAS